MTYFPNTVPELLIALRTNNATAPRLTWYGPDSERVELSGRVLDNWVAKTANFLVDELDAEPGTVVALDMPVHWRSIVWLLAGWAAGTTAVVASAPGLAPDFTPSLVPDIVATTNPLSALEAYSLTGQRPFVAAVALPALAMRWMGELPADVIDYSGEVRAHADVFFAQDAASPASAAFVSPAGVTSYQKLFAQDTTTDGFPTAASQQRILLQARDGWDGVVLHALHTWANGGSIVLLDPTVQATDHLCQVENVTKILSAEDPQVL